MPLATDFAQQIASAHAHLQGVSEAASLERRYPGAWSRREILGHLLDSALNNHNRFVRATLAGNYAGPGYEQQGWVALHGYHQWPWAELVSHWAAANDAITRLVAQIPATALANPCVVGDDPPATLEFLITDYLRHVHHHVAQLTLAERGPDFD